MLVIILGIIGVVLLGLAAFNVPSLPRINWGWAGLFCFGLIWVIGNGVLR